MNQYKDHEKIILGQLFCYYRTFNKIKWEEIKASNICSHTTYSKMEKGIIVKDNYYTKFIEFYHLTYQLIPSLNHWYQEYLPKVNHAFIWNEMDKFEELRNELEARLGQYQHLLIYGEVYEMFIHLFNFYQNGTYMTKEEIEQALLLLNVQIFDEDSKALLLELMFISCNNNIADMNLFDRIYDYSVENNHVIIFLVKGIYQNCKENFFECLKMCKNAFLYWNKLGNTYRMVRCLNGMYAAYKNMDQKEAEKIAQLLLSYIDSNLIPDRLKNSIVYNIAVNDYLYKNYEKSFDLFLKCIEEYHDIDSYIFVGSLCTNMNLELPDFFDEMNYKKYCYPQLLKYYYLKKKKENDKILADYIINVIVKEQLMNYPYIHPFWSMFESEMLWIVSKNNKYMKYYLKYRQLMKDICIDA